MSHQPDPIIPNLAQGLKPCRYSESRLQWRHVSSRDRKYPPPSQIKIVTWNVDYITPHIDERMLSVLEHLQSGDVLGYFRDDGSGSDSDDSDDDLDDESPPLCCILLQEVHDSALAVILQDDWVRKHFIVIPIRSDKWPPLATYGNVTLVSKYLQVQNAQIIDYGISNMQRTALVVDVKMRSGKGRNFNMRVINTHLESLPKGTHARPVQLSIAMDLLSQTEVDGGIVAGDMNSIAQEDEGLGESLGLQDAWQKGDLVEEGFTWGYQGGTEGGKFPKARLDKIYFIPTRKRKYFVTEPQRIGVDVEAESFQGGQEVYASDHFGLLSTAYVYN